MAFARGLAPGPQRRVRRPQLRLTGSISAGAPHLAPLLLFRFSVPTAETPCIPVSSVTAEWQCASAPQALQVYSAGIPSLVMAAAVAVRAAGPLAGGAGVAAAVRRAAAGAGSDRSLRGWLPAYLTHIPGAMLVPPATRERVGWCLLTDTPRVITRARRWECMVSIGVQLAARPKSCKGLLGVRHAGDCRQAPNPHHTFAAWSPRSASPHLAHACAVGSLRPCTPAGSGHTPPQFILSVMIAAAGNRFGAGRELCLGSSRPCSRRAPSWK